jgi:hypothetical protein
LRFCEQLNGYGLGVVKYDVIIVPAAEAELEPDYLWFLERAQKRQ